MNKHFPKYNLEDMHIWAAEKGGRCLSREYWDFHSPLSWQCEKGHTFDMTPTGVVHGHWCRACGKRKYSTKTIEDMQKIAEMRGGKCLSTEYISNHVKLEWQCDKGHRWFTTPSMIIFAGGGKRTERVWTTQKGEHKSIGTWCPHCVGMVRSNIDNMHKFALKREGKCLSTEYVNMGTKLLWECKHGHRWMQRPGDIRDGSWCPYCIHKRAMTIEEMKALAIRLQKERRQQAAGTE